MHLSQTRLLVADFATSFRFYSQTLGLPVSFGTEQGPYASFEAGHDMLAIYGRAMMEDAIGHAPSQAPRGPDQFLLGFAVDDVDQAAEALQSRGVTLVSPPTDRPVWQTRVAHFRDPDGNLIEISGPLKEQAA